MNKNTQNFQNTNTTDSSFSPVLFDLSDFGKKSVEVRFSLEETSSDGGLLLLSEVEKQIGIIDRLALCITDNRDERYVKHPIDQMLRQRIFQIAAGYEDANDCDSLKDDGILKVCAGQEESLASQPTMSRFENSAGLKSLYRMGKALVDNFIESYATEPKIIVLDCDDTSSITYGQQELAIFNNYYGDYCFMPLHIYEGFSGKVITTILKPGRRSKSQDTSKLMKRIIQYLRKRWPKTMIILRGDSHFCSNQFMDWSREQQGVEFITGLAGNAVLNKHAEITIKSAENEYKATNKPVKRYHSFMYKAESWNYSQRVVVKVEVNFQGINVRYIVSSLQNVKAKKLYEVGYCARGSMELRIKEHKTYLNSDRMSCTDFLANQFRLFLHSAAYVLIHTLQKEVLQGTEYCNSTMKTIQLKLIKIAARVKFFKTKVKIELPLEFPTQPIFEKCFLIFKTLRN
jgi:hypothetical protein